LGVRLDEHSNLNLVAPHGIDDVINLKVKPTDNFKADEDRIAIYKERIAKKNWKSNWGQIKVQYQ